MKIDVHLTFHVRSRNRARLFEQTKDNIKNAGFDPDEADIVLRIEHEGLTDMWIGEANVYVHTYSD